MRVAVLWTGPAGYLNACLRELASRPGVELFVAYSEISSTAPYEKELFAWIDHQVVWRDESDFDRLNAQLQAFQPQVVVVAGWHVPSCRRIMKQLKGRCLRLMTMDNRWSGTLRQWLGKLTAAKHLLPMADAAWVPGYHQATSPRKLGFPLENILHGSLSCEHQAFSAVYERRVKRGDPLPQAFVFVGRLIAEKGIQTLARAYEY